MRNGSERVRRDIGFYGSTPAYQPVLELHGLGDLAKNLNKLVRNGDWDKLAAQIPDDVLDLFAAVGTFDELPKKVAARFGGISDTISVGFSLQSDAAAVSALVQKLQAIPGRFKGFSHDWQLLRDHERGRLAPLALLAYGGRACRSHSPPLLVVPSLPVGHIHASDKPFAFDTWRCRIID
jgi:hypothetical protein